MLVRLIFVFYCIEKHLGELIVGRVDLNLSVPVQAKEVKIKWKGFEKTYIENTVVENTDQGSRVRTDVYKVLQ